MHKSTLLLLALITFTLALINKNKKFSNPRARFCARMCKNNDSKLCSRICSKVPVPQESEKQSEDAALPEMDSASLWGRYRQEIVTFLRMGDKNTMPNLKLVTGVELAEWGDNQALFNKWADMVPKWKGAFARTTVSFIKEYEAFLYNLKIPRLNIPQSVEDELDDLQDAMEAAEARVESEESKCADKFNQVHATAKVGFETFKAFNCPRIRRYQRRYDQALGDYEYLDRTSAGKFYMARNAVRLLRTPTKNYKELSSLKNFAAKAKIGQVTGYTVTIEGEKETYRESRSNMEIGASVGAMIKGVTIDASGGYKENKIDIKTHKKEFKMQFGCEGFAAIPVHADRSWFVPEVLRNYRSGPFSQPQTYFGAKGTMGLRPRTFYVVSKPTVIMFVSQEDKRAFEKTTGWNGSIGVGYMAMGNVKFNMAKDDVTIEKDGDKNSFKISLKSKDPTPQIIAIDYYAN